MNEKLTAELIRKLFKVCSQIELSSENGSEILENILCEEAFDAYSEYCKSETGEMFLKGGLDPDPANWTDEDIDAVAQRARRGERITL